MANYNREETIKRHREMWNWIANQVENGTIALDKTINLFRLKEKAIETLHPEDLDKILANCYLCEYANRMLNYYFFINGIIIIRDHSNDRCNFCPLGKCKGRPMPNYCLDGLYGQLHGFCNREEFAKVAREIANLPEREDKNE